MARELTPDLCIIGAGSGGLSVAAGASQMGAEVVLIEAGEMGGDCLNRGCVPSKALLAAAHHAHGFEASAPFGLSPTAPPLNFRQTHDHVHGVIDAIAPVDSQERYEGFGVNVMRTVGRFVDPQTVEADGVRIKPRRFVIATGSKPVAPPIPGLDQVRYFTNESLFENTERPAHLLIIGGGPIGCEMAQAHRQLGAEVSVFDLGPIMPKDDPEAVEVVRTTLKGQGVTLHEGIKIDEVRPDPAGVALRISKDGQSQTVSGSHLLVATGRAPDLARLNLDAAGIEYDKKGIKVDDRLKSVSHRKVFVAGDAAGHYQFTHIAGYHASVIVKQALFRLPAKVDYAALPWVTFTDPELAQVGLSEPMAKDKGGEYQVLRWAYDENDRAQAERRTEGLIKVIITPKGRVLGATIVGKSAGELIGLWGLAISQKLKVSAVAQMIAPYPTLFEVNKRAAGSYYTPKLFTERTRKVVKFLGRFG